MTSFKKLFESGSKEKTFSGWVEGKEPFWDKVIDILDKQFKHRSGYSVEGRSPTELMQFHTGFKVDDFKDPESVMKSINDEKKYKAWAETQRGTKFILIKKIHR